MVQFKAYFDILNRLGVNRVRDRQTGGRMDRYSESTCICRA